MPFTGDSSDSESDGGGEGTMGCVSGTGIENTVGTVERAISTKSRGINPRIINQPPTPLLSRKKHPPCTLTQVVPDGAAGCYDHSVTANKAASPALSPKYAVNKINTNNLTTLESLKSPSNNNNNVLERKTVSPNEPKKSATFSHPNLNGFIPSSPYSAKTPTRCAIIPSTSKKLGTLYLEVVKIVVCLL